MLPARTPLDHMYVNVTLDIMEMDETAQVNLISRYMYSVLRVVLHDTFDYSTAPFSRVAGKLDDLLPITRFNLRLLPTFRKKKGSKKKERVPICQEKKKTSFVKATGK